MTAKVARAAAAREFAREHWPRLLAAAGLLYVIFGNAGFRSMVSNWMELRRLKTEIVQLDRDQADLDVKLKALRSGDGGVERAARRDLGYIKKGEIEYRFPPPKPLQ
ncbi:MAG TPA: septum formation initiator family protein [Elusimicrobiota bacterium]|jgi:cell division protein FtsB|nr:septum formation initiator family protein [Elusimicrobiota bacterium]